MIACCIFDQSKCNIFRLGRVLPSSNMFTSDRPSLRSDNKGLKKVNNFLMETFHFRLKVFYEEELDVPLVLFNEVLDHVLRIDRIFRQPQGHLLLIGISGSGKTTLSRFVAWMNGLSVFQVSEFVLFFFRVDLGTKSQN